MKKYLLTWVAALTVSLVAVVSSFGASAAGDVVLDGAGWTCDGPVDLDLVKVSNPPGDAITFAAGCTGRIGRIEVDTRTTDGVKIKQGAHDITVGGGYVTCTAMRTGAHQDAVQAMSGRNVSFNGVAFDCLGNSNFFINDGAGTVRPSGIVCDGCFFAGGSATTVRVNVSDTSGARNSVACVGRQNRNAYLFTARAVDPVNVNNVTLPRTDPRC